MRQKHIVPLHFLFSFISTGYLSSSLDNGSRKEIEMPKNAINIRMNISQLSLKDCTQARTLQVVILNIGAPHLKLVMFSLKIPSRFQIQLRVLSQSPVAYINLTIKKPFQIQIWCLSHRLTKMACFLLNFLEIA